MVVIDMDVRAEVRRMIKERVPKARIAKELGIARNSVIRYGKDLGPTKREVKNRKVSKLEPFKEYVRQRLAAVPLLWTIRLLLELQEQGYRGGYTLLKEFVRPLRKARAMEVVLRYETPPGRQAQVDWGHFGHIELDGKRRKLYLFSMVLGYSRARYIEFTVKVDTATFIRCHLNAFRFFGGHTEEILYDNLKSVVIERALKLDESTWNPLFENFRRHYGFVARLCRPRRPQTKGKVESVIKDSRYGFFIGRSFTSLNDLNHQAGKWCGEVVFERKHRTTGVPPSARFEEEKLAPFDAKPPFQIELEHEREIDRESMVSFWGNRYSVPYEHAPGKAIVRLVDETIRIEVKGQVVAEHELRAGTCTNVRVKEHFAGMYGKIRKLNEEAHQRSLSFYDGPEPPEVERRPLEVYDRVIEEDDKKEVKA